MAAEGPLLLREALLVGPVLVPLVAEALEDLEIDELDRVAQDLLDVRVTGLQLSFRFRAEGRHQRAGSRT